MEIQTRVSFEWFINLFVFMCIVYERFMNSCLYRDKDHYFLIVPFFLRSGNTPIFLCNGTNPRAACSGMFVSKF